jgi:quercetin dioxygenase-like cupin family protein
MSFHSILEKLKDATHPVAGSIAKGTDFTILGIAFKKDMVLKEHVTNLPAKLIVLEGSVSYKTFTQNLLLEKYSTHEIPAHEKHSVVAHEDSICLLIRAKFD